MDVRMVMEKFSNKVKLLVSVVPDFPVLHEL